MNKVIKDLIDSISQTQSYIEYNLDPGCDDNPYIYGPFDYFDYIVRTNNFYTIDLHVDEYNLIWGGGLIFKTANDIKEGTCFHTLEDVELVNIFIDKEIEANISLSNLPYEKRMVFDTYNFDSPHPCFIDCEESYEDFLKFSIWGPLEFLKARSNELYFSSSRANKVGVTVRKYIKSKNSEQEWRTVVKPKLYIDPRYEFPMNKTERMEFLSQCVFEKGLLFRVDSIWEKPEIDLSLLDEI